MMRTGKKKIAIVTGASSGMGRECVIQLADRFAGLEEIWVIARRGRRLDKLAGKVPVPLRVLELDLQEELVFAELEEKLEWEDPEVKILVNGAGFGKATKAFVLSYSRALAMELKPRQICVTAVCPGPVKTEFFDIAETTGEIPLYKRLVMADPKKVVKKALRDSMMGKTVSVYGFLMKAFFLLAKILPHDVILSLLFSE